MATPKKKGSLGGIVIPNKNPVKPNNPLPPITSGGLTGIGPDDIDKLPMAPTVPQEFDIFEQLMNAYTAQINAAAAAQRENEQRELAAQNASINKNYDKSANGAYIQYKQNTVDLPEKLSNLGATGGASESAQVKLQSAYGTNLANNENARGTDLSGAQSGYAKRIADIDSNAANSLASAQFSVGQQKMADELDKQKEATAKAEAKAEKDKAKKEQAVIDSFNRQQMVKIAKAKQKYEDVTVWTDKGTGKIRYYATNKKKLTSSGSSSSSRSVRSSGSYTNSGGSGGGNTGDKPKPNKPKLDLSVNTGKVRNYILQNASKMISNPTAVVNDVEKRLKSGKLTDGEAAQILKGLKK